jgi:hypothetical protein
MSEPEIIDGPIRSGTVYVVEMTKRCMTRGCRAKATHAVVAYSFDSGQWVHASVCGECMPRAKEGAKEASARTGLKPRN